MLTKSFEELVPMLWNKDFYEAIFLHPLLLSFNQYVFSIRLDYLKSTCEFTWCEITWLILPEPIIQKGQETLSSFP